MNIKNQWTRVSVSRISGFLCIWTFHVSVFFLHIRIMAMLKSARTAKSSSQKVLFLKFTIILRSGLLSRIRRSVCILRSQKIFYLSFCRIDFSLCIYYLIVWSNLNFLHNSHCIIFPTHSWLLLYSFCVSLLHSLMWFIVSSLSPHNLHLLFCCVLCIFTLTSSSSSCRAARTDIPDPLSPLFPIVHHLWQVFWTTSRIFT